MRGALAEVRARFGHSYPLKIGGRAIEVGPGQVLAKILQRMKLGIASSGIEEPA